MTCYGETFAFTLVQQEATDYKSEALYTEGRVVYNISATPSEKKERGITKWRRQASLYEDNNFAFMEIEFSFTEVHCASYNC